jgi:hypothetical protein
MRTNETYKSNQSFGLLLLGLPKSGKTNVAMCFPAPYFADCDNNLSSAVRRFPDKKFWYDIINIDDQGKEVPKEKRWTRLTDNIKLAVADPNIKTIVIDSLSLVADYAIDHICHEQKIPVMRIQDWGSLKNLMTRFVTYLRSTGKMIIVTGHEKYDKDEVSGTILYRINFPGSLADNIGAFFSDVWRCECEEKGGKYVYTVRTMPTPRMALGNSLGLPATFEFTWDEIQKKLGVV